MQIILEQGETDLKRLGMEVSPGMQFVCLETTAVDGREDASFCPWAKLPKEQLQAFQVAYTELIRVAGEIRALFANVPRPEPGEDW